MKRKLVRPILALATLALMPLLQGCYSDYVLPGWRSSPWLPVSSLMVQGTGSTGAVGVGVTPQAGGSTVQAGGSVSQSVSGQLSTGYGLGGGGSVP